jgi:hypothetical protein
MSSEHIVSLLIAERDRIQSAIDALNGGAPEKRRGRPPGKKAEPPATAADAISRATKAPAKKKRVMSAAGRKAISDAAKARWAKLKTAKKSK